MANKTKNKDHNKLDLIARNLASLTLTPLMGNGEIKLAIEARFEPVTYTSDSHPYRVTIGVTKAILELEHPGHDRTNSYHAKLPAKVWEAHTSTDLKKSGSIKADIGTKFKFPFFFFGAAAKAEIEKANKNGASEHSTFDIITATPNGWTIGGKEGDPRQNVSVVQESSEVGCLRGAYFTKARDEDSHAEVLAKKVVVCALQEKSGANNNLLTATLFCAEGGLRLELKNESNLQIQVMNEQRKKSEALRDAFIAICAARATVGKNPQGENHFEQVRINADLYLDRVEKSLGKISRAKK